MKQFALNLGYFLFSLMGSIVLIHELALPTLVNYPRLNHMIKRFAYTEQVLTFFLFLSIWLFLIQWQLEKFSVIYLYLVYAIYLFLLFVVLFAKAKRYHAYFFDPFDFLIWEKRVIVEAILNVLYLIPLGGLYGLKAKNWEFVVIALTTILGIETLQYVFYVGTFAISDILLNFIGCTIGYIFARFVLLKTKKTIS